MFAKRITRWVLVIAIAASVSLSVAAPALAQGTDESARKIKTKVQPAYPELARRMNLAGMVKVQVVVSANGTAKSMKPIGGNPVLIEAATDALKKWRWEAGSETTELVEFRFTSQE